VLKLTKTKWSEYDTNFDQTHYDYEQKSMPIIIG